MQQLQEGWAQPMQLWHRSVNMGDAMSVPTKATGENIQGEDFSKACKLSKFRQFLLGIGKAILDRRIAPDHFFSLCAKASPCHLIKKLPKLLLTA